MKILYKKPMIYGMNSQQDKKERKKLQIFFMKEKNKQMIQ